MSNKYFNNLLQSIDCKLNNNQLEKFELFKQELISWNEKINLTRITSEDEIYAKHFIDSLIPCKYINENSKIIDVGTGAGFPGIPIKIYLENTDITLLDSVNKKLIYLNSVIDKLKLENIKVVHGRAEDIAKKEEYREMYDIAISRAVANMTTLVELLIPFVKIGGKIICMKGPNVLEELEESKKAIEILGGKIENIVKYEIPNIEIEYNLVIINKIKSTPNKYPRRAGLPKEQPLK